MNESAIPHQIVELLLLLLLLLLQ